MTDRQNPMLEEQETQVTAALHRIEPVGEGIYLGSFEDVYRVCAEFFDQIPDVLLERGEDGILQLLHAYANRFAYGGEGDVLIPNWHNAAGIGRYVAEKFNLPGDRIAYFEIRDMFALATKVYFDCLEGEAAGTLSPDQITFLLTARTEEMAAALTGIWESVYPPDDD